MELKSLWFSKPSSFVYGIPLTHSPNVVQHNEILPLLEDNPPWVSSVSAHLVSRGTDCHLTQTIFSRMFV